MSLWFRAYSEVLNDPKIQRLPLDAFKAWHNALYLAGQIDSRDGVIGTIEDVSFAFRETKEAVSSAFQPLLDNGLIVTVGETFQIVSWKKRQYKSDTSTDRVKRFRERSRNVTETAPDTDADTDNSLSKDKAQDDPDKVFWASAKSYLGAGKASLIGKWIKDHGKTATIAAITSAQSERAVDPIQFIQGHFRKQRNNGYGPGHSGVPL